MKDASEVWPEIRATYAARDHARCEALLADLPESEQTRFWGVRLASRREQFETVRERAAAYLADYPPHVEVVQTLARAANKLKDAPLAASWWRRLADLAPDPVEALRQAARANAKVGNDSFAITAAGRLTTIAAERPEILPTVATTLLELDQFEALASLVARTAPSEPEAVEALAQAWTEADEPRGLAAVIAGRLTADPDMAPPIDTDSMVEDLLSSGARRERDGAQIPALNDFRAALVLSPDETLARHGVERLKNNFLVQARALNRIGEFDEAIDNFRALYRSDPDDPEVVLAYGRALMNIGELELAGDMWRGAIAANADLEEAWLQRARALEWLDRPIEAVAAWSAVLERWPDNGEARKHRKKLSSKLFGLGRDAIAADDGLAAAKYLRAVPADADERAVAEQRFERIGRLLVKAMRADYKAREFAKVVTAGSIGREVAPDNLDLHRLLAKAAARLRQFDLAAAAWERVAELQDGAEAQIELGRNRAALGEYGAAAIAAATAAAFDPMIAGLADLRKIIDVGGGGATPAAGR